MKKFLIQLSFAPFLLLILACSKKPIFQSKYEPGNMRGRAFSSSIFDSLQPTSEGKLFYGVFNNDKDITVRLKVADESDQRKMLFSGFNIWLDNTSKERRILGIQFPSVVKNNEFIMQRKVQGQSHNFAADLKNLVNDAKLEPVEYIGFKSTSNIFTDINADDKGNLCYQVTIPFIALDYDPSTKTPKIISIGFESEKPQRPSNPRISFENEEGHPGGEMGRGGMGGEGMGHGGTGRGTGSGGYGGHRGQYPGGGGQRSFEPINLWIKVQLIQ